MSTAGLPPSYRVNSAARGPLLEYLLNALRACGCLVIHATDASAAPFRIGVVTPNGERLGLVVYAFLANARLTRHRPTDEWRFQVKYGAKDGKLHELWQDPFGLHVTLFVGIDPKAGFLVGADPVLNSPTKFFISKEFKQSHVDQVLSLGWHAWERDSRRNDDPVEVLVGTRPDRFLDYVMFEREALGEDQGHRLLLAERFVGGSDVVTTVRHPGIQQVRANPRVVTELQREFALTQAEIFQLIQDAPRLKMAVRGWVAEAHLQKLIQDTKGITDFEKIETDGKPDFWIRYRRSRKVFIECKNVLRKPTKDGNARIDFQRTRASKRDSCSRYYRREEFDLLAACMHARTVDWSFQYRLTRHMEAHSRCARRLASSVVVTPDWPAELEEAVKRVLDG